MQSISNIFYSTYRRVCLPVVDEQSTTVELARQIDTLAPSNGHEPQTPEVLANGGVDSSGDSFLDTREHNFDVGELGQLLSKLVRDSARNAVRETACSQARHYQIPLSDFQEHLFSALGPDVLSREVNSTFEVFLTSCLSHLSSVLATRQARAQLMDRGLQELQHFFTAMKQSCDFCEANAESGVSDKQVLEHAVSNGYGHPAFDFEGDWNTKRDIKSKAVTIVDKLLPKFKAVLEREVTEQWRGQEPTYLLLLQAFLNSSMIESHTRQFLIEVCETGLHELVEKLSDKEFWSYAINSGLDQCEQQLSAYHAAKFCLSSMGYAADQSASETREDLLARQLAHSCAETSSSFFHFIPLLQKIRSFLDRLLRPVTRLGQAWSEKFLAESLENSLCSFLDIPTASWSAQLIDALTKQLKSSETRSNQADPIKAHVSKVAKRTLLVVAFSPLYWLTGTCNSVANGFRKFLFNLDELGNSHKSLALIARAARGFASGISTFCKFWVNLPPCVWALKCWFRVVDLTLGWITAPFAKLVGGHVESRLDSLAKSPLKKLFVHRLLDVLIQELQLQESESEPTQEPGPLQDLRPDSLQEIQPAPLRPSGPDPQQPSGSDLLQPSRSDPLQLSGSDRCHTQAQTYCASKY